MNRRELRFTFTADEQLTALEHTPALKGPLNQVRKTLGYLEINLRAKSFQTHEFESISRRYGEKIFEAYGQQNAPGAYHIFWHYGTDEVASTGSRIAIITVIAIIPHRE